MGQHWTQDQTHDTLSLAKGKPISADNCCYLSWPAGLWPNSQPLCSPLQQGHRFVAFFSDSRDFSRRLKELLTILFLFNPLWNNAILVFSH